MNNCICDGDWDGTIKINGEILYALKCPRCGKKLNWYYNPFTHEKRYEVENGNEDN